MTVEIAELGGELQSINAFVSNARDQLRSGLVVDIGPLEERIDRACAALTSLTPSQARTFKQLLLVLADEVNLLESELRTYHDGLSKELQGLSQRQKATAAYGGKSGAGGDRSG